MHKLPELQLQDHRRLGFLLHGQGIAPDANFRSVFTPMTLERNMTVVFKKKESELKKRKPKFSLTPTKTIVCIEPDLELQGNFTILDIQERSIQEVPQISCHEVNTESIEFAASGMCHVEGGWPKDMSTSEEDQKLRYRKKIEKDELFIHSLLQLGTKVDRSIRQNNAVNIYELYFDEGESKLAEGQEPLKTINVIRDPNFCQRTITDISFDCFGKVAVAYSSMDLLSLKGDIVKESYIWDINISSHPELAIKGSSWLHCLQYNPKDHNVIVAGQVNGQISWWDIRQGGRRPTDSTSLSVSHTHCVTALRWMPQKNRFELFSTSIDGQVLWWDTRKLNASTDTIILDPNKEEEASLKNALTATALEYELTMPNKFMVATEQGIVVSCNRRARSVGERISLLYPAHIAPVYSVQRNPFFLKNFLTVGDWTVKLWAEDFKESCILQTKPSPAQVRCGCWSPTRASVIYTVRLDGVLDSWDLLANWGVPTLSSQVVDEGLEIVKPNEDGRLLATGSENGTLTFLQIPNRLIQGVDKHERSAFTALLERETRRERVLDARRREQRLRERVRALPHLTQKGGNENDLRDPVKEAEEQYLRAVEELREQMAKEIEASEATVEVTFSPDEIYLNKDVQGNDKIGGVNDCDGPSSYSSSEVER